MAGKLWPVVPDLDTPGLYLKAPYCRFKVYKLINRILIDSHSLWLKHARKFGMCHTAKWKCVQCLNIHSPRKTTTLSPWMCTLYQEKNHLPACIHRPMTTILWMHPSAKYIPSWHFYEPVFLSYVFLHDQICLGLLSWLVQFSAVNDGTSLVLKLSAHD